jgi:hypothetical protein
MIDIDVIEEATKKNTEQPERKHEVFACDNFYDSLDRHQATIPDLDDKVSDFVKFKQANPDSNKNRWPHGTDEHMGSDGHWKKVPKLKHASLGFDMRIFYTIEGNQIKLYGVHPHDESGTGNPKNPRKQEALAKKMSKQKFEPYE